MGGGSKKGPKSWHLGTFSLSFKYHIDFQVCYALILQVISRNSQIRKKPVQDSSKIYILATTTSSFATWRLVTFNVFEGTYLVMISEVGLS
jgi:hypothetical protein